MGTYDRGYEVSYAGGPVAVTRLSTSPEDGGGFFGVFDTLKEAMKAAGIPAIGTRVDNGNDSVSEDSDAYPGTTHQTGYVFDYKNGSTRADYYSRNGVVVANPSDWSAWEKEWKTFDKKFIKRDIEKYKNKIKKLERELGK